MSRDMQTDDFYRQLKADTGGRLKLPTKAKMEIQPLLKY